MKTKSDNFTGANGGNGGWRGRQARRLSYFLLCAALSAPAANMPTLIYSSLRFTGSTNNRSFRISLASDPLQIGTNIVFGVPLTIQPMNGVAVFRLLPANYWMKIDQVERPIFLPVPDSTNYYSVWDLATYGLRHMFWVTNWFSLADPGNVVTNHYSQIANLDGGLVTGNSVWTNGIGSGTNSWQAHLLGSSLSLVPNFDGTHSLLFLTNGLIGGALQGQSFGLPVNYLLFTNAAAQASIYFDDLDRFVFKGGIIQAGSGAVFAGDGQALTNLGAIQGTSFDSPVKYLLFTNAAAQASIYFDDIDRFVFKGGIIQAGSGAVFAGDGQGLTNLNLSITGTNATPPASTNTIKSWVNVTLPDGNLFKLPLYQ